MLDNKSILITGGTGSFGVSFVETILKKFKKIKRLVIYSRDEYKQFIMEEKFPSYKYPFIRFFLGDVRDLSRLNRALEGIDTVIHAAALKQLPKAEYNPDEFIKTNIIGAQNLIEACLLKNVGKVIALSTDKAAAPINLYGATKLCSDKLFIAANNIRGSSKTIFSIVRYGNVAGSRGSIIPFFKSISSQNNFPITDEKMTRFWITLEESIEMVLWALQYSKGAEIFVPKLPSFKIVDLAKAINPKAKIKIIGIRQGEKIHEDLITLSDSISTYDFGKYYAILNNYSEINIKNYNLKNIKRVSDNFFYNSGSNSDYLNISDLQKNLKNIL
jgi:UDP-N-acetylglucosamine 4,6-dehydratase (inverting)